MTFLYFIYKSQSAKSWPQTDAVVQKSQLVASSDSEGTTYKAQIEYQYNVGPQVFSSSRISVFDAESSNESHHRELVGNHPVGLKFKVYYDPSDPSYSLIHPGINFGLGLFTVLTMTVFIVCFGITCHAVIGIVKVDVNTLESAKVDPTKNAAALFEQFPDPPNNLGIRLHRRPDFSQRLFVMLQRLFHSADHSSENNFLNLTGKVVYSQDLNGRFKGCLTYFAYFWGSAISWSGIIMSVVWDVPIKINGSDTSKITGIAAAFGFLVLWVSVIRWMSDSGKGNWTLKLDDRRLLFECNDGGFDCKKVFELNEVRSLQVEGDGKLLINHAEEPGVPLFYPGAISLECAQWIADSINQFLMNRQAKP